MLQKAGNHGEGKRTPHICGCQFRCAGGDHAGGTSVGDAKNDWNDSHKVTICHVTNSATNSYVIIEVDVAAFDGVGKSDHKHHMSKDGLRSDVDVPKGTTDIAACLDDDPPPPQPNT